ncbi:uncharacterized protein [Dendropsophus ebraccatus]|uniref:uncharacterized protein n=1 Tax=Dendropsophus ebraccatus TaxID=150705 RepID=UPI003831503E
MKTIIFMVLAGLSLAQEDLGCTRPASTVGKEECLAQALKEVSDFKSGLYTFLCKYSGSIEEPENDENYKKALDKAIRGLACAGCLGDGALETGDTLEDLLKDSGKLVKHAGPLLLKVTDSLGLTPAVTNLVCKLGEGLLTSECLTKLLKQDVDQLVKSINKLFCTGDKSALTVEQVLKLLREVGCVLDDAIKTQQAQWLLEGSGESLSDTLTNVLNILKDGLVGSVPANLICNLSNVLIGVTPLLSVGGVTGGLTNGVAGGLTGGLTNSLTGGLTGGLTSGLAGGLTGGLTNGVAAGATGGLSINLG